MPQLVMSSRTKEDQPNIALALNRYLQLALKLALKLALLLAIAKAKRDSCLLVETFPLVEK